MGLSEEQSLVQQNEEGSFINNLGYRNQLAQRTVERLAQEKKFKLTLNQELEIIKDHFNGLEKDMQRFELNESLEKAASFLQEYTAIGYYSVFTCIGSLIDRYLKEGNGQKEVNELSEILSKLGHLNDMKVSFTNGFHVNSSYT